MNDISFTFGIVTNAINGLCPHLQKSIDSIINLNIPNYEIIVVGGGGDNLNPIKDKARVIDFDENVKPGWITKKKNIITEQAKYENVVYAHDYLHFDNNWYDGWKQYGENYHLAMNRIINTDGSRFRDWCIFPHQGLVEKARIFSGFQGHECMLPLDEAGFSKLQYFSGSYWVAKKHVAQEFLQNENLLWGHGEDVDFSYRVRNKYKFSMNANSSVTLLKYKDPTFYNMRPEVHAKMKEFLIMHKLYG